MPRAKQPNSHRKIGLSKLSYNESLEQQVRQTPTALIYSPMHGNRGEGSTNYQLYCRGSNAGILHPKHNSNVKYGIRQK